MIEQHTWDRIAAKFVRVIEAIKNERGDTLHDDTTPRMGDGLIRRLIAAELGRPPTDAEMQWALAHLQEMFWKSDE